MKIFNMEHISFKLYAFFIISLLPFLSFAGNLGATDYKSTFEYFKENEKDFSPLYGALFLKSPVLESLYHHGKNDLSLPGSELVNQLFNEIPGEGLRRSESEFKLSKFYTGKSVAKIHKTVKKASIVKNDKDIDALFNKELAYPQLIQTLEIDEELYPHLLKKFNLDQDKFSKEEFNRL